jgi:endonuclease/exonuclease/phosphatase family metal-dependent hydrolase
MRLIYLFSICLLSILLCSCEKEVKVISMNIGLGAKRCFGNPGCSSDCGSNCTNTACVKPLFRLENSAELIADYFEGMFSGNEQGILCLQEVKTNIQGKNVLDALIQKLGGLWEYEFFSPQGSDYGIAIVSNVRHTKKQTWDLPVPSGAEKRGAIALKFTYGGKWLWVVNTHFGLSENERILQAEEVIKKYKTFDPVVPVIIAGDFNILDVQVHGSGVSPTSDEFRIYQNTIQKMTGNGLQKLPFHPNEGRPYSFHSWNSATSGRVVDYIFWSDPAQRNPNIRTLRPGPFQVSGSNALCPAYKADSRFLTDHNGLEMKYNVFGL